ncbi:hypothetical protein EVAR_58176_1 [Eumeta japonica]|uniref:Uncharacterized protein n=1 Tax=Eumeta variegata TaxID=151549 RepID=A0A4C1X359_EUMVA|nr:hypothetical protein EVAR_58176_1 [Eumeta japonica]
MVHSDENVLLSRRLPVKKEIRQYSASSIDVCRLKKQRIGSRTGGFFSRKTMYCSNFNLLIEMYLCHWFERNGLCDAVIRDTSCATARVAPHDVRYRSIIIVLRYSVFSSMNICRASAAHKHPPLKYVPCDRLRIAGSDIKPSMPVQLDDRLHQCDGDLTCPSGHTASELYRITQDTHEFSRNFCTEIISKFCFTNKSTPTHTISRPPADGGRPAGARAADPGPGVAPAPPPGGERGRERDDTTRAPATRYTYVLLLSFTSDRLALAIFGPLISSPKLHEAGVVFETEELPSITNKKTAEWLVYALA